MRDHGLSLREAPRTGTRLRAALGLLLVLSLVAAPLPRAVDPDLQRAADALRTQYVYSDPTAESRMTDTEVGLLTKATAAAGTPLWVALLPASLLTEYGSADAVAEQLAEATGQPGVYAVVVGPDSFGAASTLPDRPVADLVREAEKSGPVPFDVVSAFVEQMRTTYGSGAPSTAKARGGGLALAVLVLVAAGGGAFAIVGRRRRLRDERRAAAQGYGVGPDPLDRSGAT